MNLDIKNKLYNTNNNTLDYLYNNLNKINLNLDDSDFINNEEANVDFLNNFMIDNEIDVSDIKKALRKVTEIEENNSEKVFSFVYFVTDGSINRFSAKRPQATVINRYAHNRKTIQAQVYDHEISKEAKKELEGHVYAEMDEQNVQYPVEGDIECEIRIYREYKKNFTKADKVLCEIGYLKPVTTPDVDNYVKLLLDAFNKIFCKDDGQVTISKATKNYSYIPRIEIDFYYRQKLRMGKLK